jgi:nucleotide-binding universal stress UspA family protein
VVLGGGGPEERALPWLRRLIGARGATLRLLTVRAPGRGVVARGRRIAYAHQAEEMARMEALARAGALASSLEDYGWRVIPEVRFGPPAETILTAAAESGADLIAVTAEEPGGIRRWWTKRVADEVLRRARVPVIVVRRVGQRAA